MSSPSSSKRFEKGVSVHWLSTGFLSEIVSYKDLGGSFKSNLYHVAVPFSSLENLSSRKTGVIRRKGAKKIAEDGTLGASYVDCLVGESHVGPVEFHLIYSQETSVQDVVDSLTSYCLVENKNPETTYVWIDSLCLNLHRVAERISSKKETPIHEFQRMSRYAARDPVIQKVLAVYTPPKRPDIVQETWSIFELFNASKNGLRVEIIMPNPYTHQIISAAKEHRLSDYLISGVDFQTSKCANVKEREVIIKLLEQSFPGRLNEGMNAWLTRFAQSKLVDFVLSNMTNDKGENQGENDTIMDEISHEIGSFLHQEKNYEMAYKLYQRSLVIREKKHQLAPDDVIQSEKLAQAYHNIGLVLQQINDVDNSLFYLKKALIIRKRLNGLYHIDTGDCYINIGHAQISLGNLDEAYDDYKTALMIEEKIHGMNHSRTASCYCGIGTVLEMMGRYDEALVYLQQSLMTREDILGIAHEDTASSHSAIATALTKKGEFEEALHHYEEAVKILERVCGMNHVKTATALNNLAMALCDQEKFMDALDYLKRACDIYVGNLGSDHPHSVMAEESYREVKKMCH